MRLLVIGSGGREHAICWRLAQSPAVEQIFCAPGNPGTASCATNVPIGAGDPKKLRAFARQQGIDLTVVGPETPLCAGIGDCFAEEGLSLFGPSARAARLEGSKAFAKAFMERWKIPTAPFGLFDEIDSATAYIDDHPDALVVKADGLAAGKGVIVCADPREAKETARWLLQGGLGDAGRTVVIESRLAGEEASFIVITDGDRICPLAASQDHKALLDGDQGPNTGGMGAYSPAPVVDRGIRELVLDQIVMPTIRGLAEEGVPYRGFLYVGLMISDRKVSVLEFNCRLGDPEAQPVLARLQDDLVPVLAGAAAGALPKTALDWSPRPALCVVMASNGYPGRYTEGLPIHGLDQVLPMENVVVFHAGTAWREGDLVTAGGRVLGVTATGDTIGSAQDRAYQAVGQIGWEGVHYRRDIGRRAVGRAVEAGDGHG